MGEFGGDRRCGGPGPGAQLLGQVGGEDELARRAVGMAGGQLVEQAPGRLGDGRVQQRPGRDRQHPTRPIAVLGGQGQGEGAVADRPESRRCPWAFGAKLAHQPRSS